MHTPDYSKPRFSITIDVFENCQTMDLKVIPGHIVSYQDIIGSLEIAKTKYAFDQSGMNAELYRKWAANQKKKQEKSQGR